MPSPKTVLITGASGGIGSACACLFAQEGYRVLLHYFQNAVPAQRLAAQLGGVALMADVRDLASVRAMFDAAGRVDVLVNNAGIAQQLLFTDITPADWAQMFAVNVTGVYNCCQCAVPPMVRRKAGAIVNVSSMWGLTGASCEVHYSAAKAAVIGFTKALAKELGPSGITVNCVAPGLIQTHMNDSIDPLALRQVEEETPLGRSGQPQEVAQAILYLAQAGFVTGQVLSPNGGLVI